MLRVRVESAAFEVPVRGEEESFLQAWTAFYRVPEGAGDALREEEVFLGEVEEEDFEELGEVED